MICRNPKLGEAMRRQSNPIQWHHSLSIWSLQLGHTPSSFLVPCLLLSARSVPTSVVDQHQHIHTSADHMQALGCRQGAAAAHTVQPQRVVTLSQPRRRHHRCRDSSQLISASASFPQDQPELLGQQQKQPGLSADGVGAVQQHQQQHAAQQVDQVLQQQQQQQQPEQQVSQKELLQQQHVEQQQQQQPHSTASSSSSDPHAVKQARLQLLRRMLAFMVRKGAVRVLWPMREWHLLGHLCLLAQQCLLAHNLEAWNKGCSAAQQQQQQQQRDKQHRGPEQTVSSCAGSHNGPR